LSTQHHTRQKIIQYHNSLSCDAPLGSDVGG